MLKSSGKHNSVSEHSNLNVSSSVAVVACNIKVSFGLHFIALAKKKWVFFGNKFLLVTSIHFKGRANLTGYNTGVRKAFTLADHSRFRSNLTPSFYCAGWVLLEY